MIYNVDEKGIMTGGSKPPNIVAAKDKIAQAHQSAHKLWLSSAVEMQWEHQFRSSAFSPGKECCHHY